MKFLTSWDVLMGYKFRASLLFFSVVTTFACVNAMMSGEFDGRYGMGGFGGSNALFNLQMRMERFKSLQSSMRELDQALHARDQAVRAERGQISTEEIDRLYPDIRRERQRLESLSNKIDSLCDLDVNENARWGRVIAKGLAGSDWESFDQTGINSFSSGVQQGLAARISAACGRWVSKKVEDTIALVVGGAWDSVLLFSLDIWSDFNKILFHEGKDSFKPSEVEGWQKLIIESMRQIEKNVKDGPKDNFRGHDMTLRNFGRDEKEAVFSDEAVLMNAWRLYVIGCAEQFDYFIDLIEKRKGYYQEEKLIVFYAEQIQRRLSDYRDLMLKAKSVKEFDDAIESNKSLLPAMRENVDQLFKRLADESKPRTVFSSGNDSMRRVDSGARQRPMADDDMPHRFGNAWGS